MAWPTSPVNTTNVDAGSDSPQLARPDILDALQKLNQIINYGQPVLPTDSPAAYFSVVADSSAGHKPTPKNSGSAMDCAEIDGSIFNTSGSSGLYTVLFNQGGGFSKSTGRFVAPTDGVYEFDAWGYCVSTATTTQANAAVDTVCVQICQNGIENRAWAGIAQAAIQGAFLPIYIPGAFTDSGTTEYGFQLTSGMMKLSAGDYVSLFFGGGGGLNVQRCYVWGFSGRRVL